METLSAGGASRTARIAGWIATGAVGLFLGVDAVGKILELPPVVAATSGLGYPEDLIRPLGVLLLLLTLAYLHPRTAVLGAVLLTAYLGGAVASQLRVGAPFPSHVLFGVYVGILLWGGIALRDFRVAAFLPGFGAGR